MLAKAPRIGLADACWVKLAEKSVELVLWCVPGSKAAVEIVLRTENAQVLQLVLRMV